jgi:hypothetical protein
MQGKNKERTERMEIRLTQAEKNTLRCLSMLRRQTLAEVLLMSVKTTAVGPQNVKLRVYRPEGGYDDRIFASEADCAEWYCEHVETLKANGEEMTEMWRVPESRRREK